MARRTDNDIFLDQLQALSRARGGPVSNIALCKSLGWEQQRYDRVWENLLYEGKIAKRKGQGGSVIPTDVSLKVFVSYSHVDDEHKNDLLAHLDPLRRIGLISVWHDGKLVAGDDWGKEIAEQIDAADVVLLLVSANFLMSDFCYSDEMKRAVQRHMARECVVVPVILRPCDWKHAEFAISEIQALPKNAKPVTIWQNRDEAFMSVAEGLKPLIQRLQQQ